MGERGSSWKNDDMECQTDVYALMHLGYDELLSKERKCVARLFFKRQNGCCKICGKHQDDLKGFLKLDHNHITGKIRGLLCNSCNVGIGFLQSDEGTDILRKACSYVEKTNRIATVVEWYPKKKRKKKKKQAVLV